MKKQDLEAEISPEALSAVFRRLGQRGGAARAKALSAKRRKAIAQQAAKQRWAKPK